MNVIIPPVKTEVIEMGALVSQIYDFGLYVSARSGGVKRSYFFIRSGKGRLIGAVPVMEAIN